MAVGVDRDAGNPEPAVLPVGQVADPYLAGGCIALAAHLPGCAAIGIFDEIQLARLAPVRDCLADVRIPVAGRTVDEDQVKRGRRARPVVVAPGMVGVGDGAKEERARPDNENLLHP